MLFLQMLSTVFYLMPVTRGSRNPEKSLILQTDKMTYRELESLQVLPEEGAG
jgi:hypothetical protein